MPHEFHSELLSACLDHEATADERATVEARMAVSADDRRLMAELAEISRELQSLPEEECPPEFADGVLRAVQAAALEPAPSARRGARLRNVAALAATAAALLLAVTALNSPRESPSRTLLTGQLTKQSASRTSSAPGKEFGELAKAAPRPADETRSLLANRTARDNRKDGLLRATGGPTAREPLVPPIALQGRPSSGTARGLVFVDDLQKLSREDVGRVLTAIEHSPQGISVVKLTVIDCDAGLDALQVLLSRNRIPRDAAEKADKSVAKDVPPQRLLAVYVQSTSDRLASVMSELNSNAQFRRLQVDPPISPQRLDRRTQRQIAMLDARQDLQTFGAAGSKPARRFGFGGGKSTRKKLAAPTNKAPRQKKNADKYEPFKRTGGRTRTAPPGGGAGIAQLDRISKQLHLTVPADLFDRAAKGVARPQIAGAGIVPRSQSGAARSMASDNKSRQTSSAAARPVRVLFVLVCPPRPSASRKSGS